MRRLTDSLRLRPQDIPEPCACGCAHCAPPRVYVIPGPLVWHRRFLERGVCAFCGAADTALAEFIDHQGCAPRLRCVDQEACLRRKKPAPEPEPMRWAA